MIATKYAGVYTITCNATGDVYVGASKTLRERINQHIRLLRRSRGASIRLQRLWNAHGEASFEFKPLFVCPPDMLEYYEQRAIDAIKPTINSVMKAGNKLKGSTKGSAIRLLVRGEELTIRELSDKYHIHRDTILFRHKAGYTGEDLISAPDVGRRRGQPKSPEHVKKIAEALKGRTIPAEVRKKISESQQGENAWNNKLTADNVAEIRRLAAEGSMPMVDIAAKFGVCEHTARSACLGRTFKNVPGATRSTYVWQRNKGA